MRNFKFELSLVLASIFMLTSCGGSSSSSAVPTPNAVVPDAPTTVVAPPAPETTTPPAEITVEDETAPPPENILEAISRVNATPTPQATSGLPAITLSGTVGKGVLSGAKVVVADALTPLDDFIETAAFLGEGRTNAQGEFSISVQTTDETSGYILIGALFDGADMICDAPSGCLGGASFGESEALGPNDGGLWAILPTPTPGAEATANLNLFTYLHLFRMLGLDFELGESEDESSGVLELHAEHFEPAATYVANAFGLEQVPFHTVPFVDVTQGISSTDANAVHMGFLGAGFLEAATQVERVTKGEEAQFDDVIENGGLSFLLPDFFLTVNEDDAERNPRTVSIEDIFDDALKVTELSPINNNALSLAVDWLQEQSAAIDSVPHGERLNEDGSYPENSLPVLLNTTFEIVENDTDGIILNIEDADSPDETFVVTIEETGDFELFEITTPNGVPTLRINQNIILDFEMTDDDFQLTDAFLNGEVDDSENTDRIFEITLNISDENGGTIREAISIEFLNDDTEFGEANYRPITLTKTLYKVKEGTFVDVILEYDDPNNQFDTLEVSGVPTPDSQFFQSIVDVFITSAQPLAFDEPQDENRDNIYELTVTLSDFFTGDFYETRDIQIEIIKDEP